MARIVDANSLLRQSVHCPGSKLPRHTKTKQLIGNLAAAYADSDLLLSMYRWASHDVCSPVGWVWDPCFPKLFLVLSTFLFPVSYPYF
jgi:hypothetical protein